MADMLYQVLCCHVCDTQESDRCRLQAEDGDNAATVGEGVTDEQLKKRGAHPGGIGLAHPDGTPTTAARPADPENLATAQLKQARILLNDFYGRSRHGRHSF